MSIVECKFENYTDYCCIISKQEINDEQIFFDGVHKEPKRNFDVDHLQFFNCVFRKMPKNFHENFPNLTKLSFWNSKMNFIEREHIGKLTELRSLMVINCGLQKLNGDLLCDLKKLQRISFANNKIENIDPEILDGLNYLKFVNFHGNLCINSLYDSESPETKTLASIKEEILYKHKPRPTAPVFRPQPMPMPQLPTSKQPQNTDSIDILPPPYDEKFEIQRWKTENEHLKAEIKNLKFLLQQQEIMITEQQNKVFNTDEENQKEEIMEKIFDDEDFKDFTIHVGDSSFNIHKLIFAAYSSYFADNFKNNTETKELNLHDITETTFRIVYDFVYNNELPEDANYLEILIAAEKFQINELIKAASAKLLDKIDEKNAFEVLELSNKINNEKLQQKAFEIIQTKVFPDRNIDNKLAKQTDILKKLIDMKKKMDEEYEKMLQGVENAKIFEE